MIARPAGRQPVDGEGGSGTSGPIRVRPRWWPIVVILAVTIVSAVALKAFVVEAFRVPSASMERTLLPGDYVLVSKIAYGIHHARPVESSVPLLPAAPAASTSPVRRGDVIVFEYPGPLNILSGSVRMPFIKRCVGLPGDDVSMKGSRVIINGKELMLPSATGIQPEEGTGGTWGPVTVPAAGTVIPLSVGTIDRWRPVLEAEQQHVGVTPEGGILLNGRPVREYTLRQNYYFVLGDNRGNSLDSRVWGFVPEDDVIGKAILVYWSWDASVAATSLPEIVRRIRWDRIGAVIR